MSNIVKENKQKILIVDDENNLREMLAILLRREGFEVFQAENGAVAVELVLEIIPDLIISDIRMPVMSGIDLLRRLQDYEIVYP